MNFGQKIKRYREMKGWSQLDLAKKLEITQQSVVYLEKKPFVKAKTLQEIERKLNFALDTLDERKNDVVIKNKEYYLQQAALFKEQYEHSIKMAKLVESMMV